MKILNNYMFGSTDAGTATAIRVVGGSDIQIRNNTIIGSFTNTLGGIENNTTDATNIVIDGNLIVNRTGGSSKAVVLTATATGIVSNNRLGVLSGTAPISGAAIDFVGGNYYKAAAGVAAGTLL